MSPRETYDPPATIDQPDGEPSLEERSRGGDVALALFLVLSYGAPLVLGGGAAVAELVNRLSSDLAVFLGPCAALGVVIAATVLLYKRLRNSERGRAIAVKAAEVMVLGVLPVWGLIYSHFLGRAECKTTSCMAGSTVFRPFAEPEVFGLIALHAVTVVAYAISRRRPGALRPLAEALVNATLLAGAIAHAVIAVHVARWLVVGVLVAPVFLPCAGPLLTVLLYLVELRARLRRRGREADTPAPHVVPDTPFRQGPVQVPLPAAPRVHQGLLLRTLALSHVLLGVHAVIHALWLGRADGALQVFTRTCEHVLSQVPLVVLPEDCHYLCTVAARGHSWLVRPERLGRRRGVAIVVNRQLALANAFEDLLHERWPRFGRLARRIYDRVGLPVSRYIRRPWLADLTYLAMKPAEWLFALALLLLDRGDPERRIDRMYR